MRNLIFNALAFKEGFDTSTQIKNYNNKLETYIKNSFVSLKSAKINNNDVDTVLFTNFDFPLEYKDIFEKNDIKVIKIDFFNFVLPKEFIWSLAFFKLEALDYAVKKLDYDNYLLLDTDTFVINELNDLWEECYDGILLYDLDHRVSHPHREEIYNNMNKYKKNAKKINHYGGEFIAGNRVHLLNMINELKIEYINMIDNKNIVDKSLGDEYLISISADKCTDIVIRANKYIYRYWTSLFYLVSTNYIHNAVDIWHLPQEKELGMIWLYNYYRKNNEFPSIRRSAKKFGFPRYKTPLKNIIKRGYKKYF